MLYGQVCDIQILFMNMYHNLDQWVIKPNAFGFFFTRSCETLVQVNHERVDLNSQMTGSILRCGLDLQYTVP